MAEDNSSESERVLHALNFLTNLSEDGLRSNLDKVKETILRLQQRIEGCTTTKSPRYGPTTRHGGSFIHSPHQNLLVNSSGGQGLEPASKEKASLPKSNDCRKTRPSRKAAVPGPGDYQESTMNHNGSPLHQSTKNNSSDQLEKIETLLQKFIKDLPHIRGLVKQLDPITTDLKPQKLSSDHRVNDLLIADGTTRGDPNYKYAQLRRLLSQRSLATEHCEWEIKNLGRSSLERRRRALDTCNSEANHALDKCNSEANTRVQFKTAFLERFDQIYLASVKRAIEHGNRILCIEGILDDDGGPGFSAIMLWYYTDFRIIAIKHLKDLAMAFRDHPPIREFAKKTTGWVLQWQTQYDGSKKSEAHRIHKRPASTGSSHCNKRARCSAVSITQEGANLHSSSNKPIDPRPVADNVAASSNSEAGQCIPNPHCVVGSLLTARRTDSARSPCQEPIAESIEVSDPVQGESQQRLSSGYAPPVHSENTHQGYTSTSSNIIVDCLANAFSRHPALPIGPVEHVEQGNLSRGLQYDTELNHLLESETSNCVFNTERSSLIVIP
ncbi:MAG: hypothetical protein Q9213_001140 [Squamulea squamosa]